MRQIRDLRGQRFGRLTAVEVAGRDVQGRATWEVKCDCGVTRTVRSRSLISGLTQSCGCLRREVSAQNGRLYGHLATGRPKGDQVNYETAHYRVGQGKGKASEHACFDCGKRALDWSLNADLPEKFSMDSEDYVPRCRKCHVGFDRQTVWYIQREIDRRNREAENDG